MWSHEQPASGAEASSSSGRDVVAPVPVTRSLGILTSTSAASPQASQRQIYEVNVKGIDGTVTSLEVPSHLQGLDLKRLISERLRVPPEGQRLICRGHAIQDEDLVSQHITENGQTIHMVQRPIPAPGTEPPAATGPASGGEQQPYGQGHPIQFRVPLESGPPNQVPVDLSQLLAAMRGAATVVHATPLNRGPVTAPAPAQPAPAQTSSASGQAAASSQQSMTSRFGPALLARQSWHSMFWGLSLMGLMVGISGWCIAHYPASSGSSLPWYGWVMCYHALSLVLGLPTVYLALRTASPLRGLGAFFPDPAGTADRQNAQVLLGQVLNSLSAQGTPIVVQSGVQAGAGANVLTALLGGDGVQWQDAVAMAQDTPLEQNMAPASDDTPYQEGPVPWGDVQHLSHHLSMLLGRMDQPRLLPPANTPYGELHAFLSALHGVTSELCVGINDLQAVVAHGDGPSHDHVHQFAGTLEVAAETLRAVAASLRNEEGETDADVDTDPAADRPGAVHDRGQDGAEGANALAEHNRCEPHNTAQVASINGSLAAADADADSFGACGVDDADGAQVGTSACGDDAP